MPRRARVVIPGVPHHIAQRGNQGRDDVWVKAQPLLDCALRPRRADPKPKASRRGEAGPQEERQCV